MLDKHEETLIHRFSMYMSLLNVVDAEVYFPITSHSFLSRNPEDCQTYGPFYNELTLAMEEDTKKELLTYIRGEFERRKNERNIEKIKYYLAQGRREFHQLQATLDLTGGK
jgi:hypothetical protein